jgi:hypothetical protein
MRRGFVRHTTPLWDDGTYTTNHLDRSPTLQRTW